MSRCRVLGRINVVLKIDLHTHILPEKWPDLAERYGCGDWVRLEHQQSCSAKMMVGDNFFREIESNSWDPVVRLSDCDQAGVRVQVLSTVPIMFTYWAEPEHALDLSMLLNDHMAGVVSTYPTRFVGLGNVPMQSPDLAIRELERCVKELGMPGIQIGTNINGANLDDPGVVAVLEAARDLDASIFVHPWEMLGKDRHPKYWLPWLVGMPAETATAMASLMMGGVLEKLEGLRIAFAHGGGSTPFTIGRIQHGFDVRPDLCGIDSKVSPRELLRRCYVDSLVHDADTLQLLIEVMGADRVALGSDYPFPLGEAVPGQLIESMSLDPRTRDRILSGTALEFLGLNASTFLADTKEVVHDDA
ncbi:MAG: 2-amino-3-carboxymuconate-6-semialdehyde decarboxylase [Phycisphaerae bacterium]|nr:2-amino-3-carboxymuconate-6-semialdehyde decarboxylase [Phycisphaerae bacterium]